jgi:hypothetical protein
MVKRNEPAGTEAQVQDDALFAPDSWDIGPPSARRASFRPGARSVRPPLESAAAAAELSAMTELMRAASASDAQALAAELETEEALSKSNPLEAAKHMAVTSERATQNDRAAGSELNDRAAEPLLADDGERDPDSVSGARLVRPSRRAAAISANSSFRPVVPETPSKASPRRRTFASSLPLVSFLLSGAGLGFLLFGAPARSETVLEPAPHAAAPAVVVAHPGVPVSEPVIDPVAPAPAVEPPRTTPQSKPVAANAIGASSELPQINAGAVNSKTVELSVYPVDAAVGYLGVMQTGRPPYKFEVPEGKRIAIEVAHPGYGTRKVLLDGSQTRLSIGLRKTTTK